MLTVADQSVTAETYHAALRDYDHVLTLDGNEPSQYKFQKGNPISGYKLKIAPGISFADAVPGTHLASINGGIGKLLDVYKDTSTINRYVQVAKVYPIEALPDNLIGILEIGETVSNLTIKIGKQAFYKQLEMPLRKAYTYTSKMMTINMMALDAKEGISAFLEKRKPKWKNK